MDHGHFMDLSCKPKGLLREEHPRNDGILILKEYEQLPRNEYPCNAAQYIITEFKKEYYLFEILFLAPRSARLPSAGLAAQIVSHNEYPIPRGLRVRARNRQILQSVSFKPADACPAHAWAVLTQHPSAGWFDQHLPAAGSDRLNWKSTREADAGPRP